MLLLMRANDETSLLDTETTGRKPPEHRVIEIGCVEVIDRKLTGNHFHTYQPQKRY